MQCRMMSPCYTQVSAFNTFSSVTENRIKLWLIPPVRSATEGTLPEGVPQADAYVFGVMEINLHKISRRIEVDTIPQNSQLKAVQTTVMRVTANLPKVQENLMLPPHKKPNFHALRVDFPEIVCSWRVSPNMPPMVVNEPLMPNGGHPLPPVAPALPPTPVVSEFPPAARPSSICTATITSTQSTTSPPTARGGSRGGTQVAPNAVGEQPSMPPSPS
eukprot:GHVN01087324.1.p1 GENE.GHVN01087324.1~~GHVN01087324.1.p1  ORF type:complete len:217 (-),score=16.38 GHVN01087324.1:21-671(-)